MPPCPETPSRPAALPRPSRLDHTLWPGLFLLGAVCAVFVLSTARLDDFVDEPDLPELEELDLP